MLAPGEFSVGCIGDATAPLTLVLPRGRYEYPTLVTRVSEQPFAVCLEGQHEFSSFECADNDSWKGILIPNVAIEVDETTMFDAECYSAPLGSLIRAGAQLNIVVRAEGGFPRQTVARLLIGELPESRAKMATGFTRWQIVIGEGLAKRTLKVILITQKPTA